MPNQQPAPTIQNHFIAGLKTEFTGLNFPENAATDTQNTVFTLIGDVERRGGINYEFGFQIPSVSDTKGVARSSFRWLNAGGDGLTQILVQQIGSNLYLYISSNATIANPLSTTLSNLIDLTFYKAIGSTANIALSECQYASGNGYLFVFHPNCEPFYVTFIPNTKSITANVIPLKIRDFSGIPELGVPDDYRPPVLSNEHQYNLVNQGWSQGSGWTGNSSLNTGSIPVAGQSMTLTISSQSSTNTITNGSNISVFIATCAGTGSNPHNNGSVTLVGVVTNYVTPFTSITFNVISNSNPNLNATGSWSGGNFSQTTSNVSLSLINVGFISTWFSAIGNYPSNSDIWWLYKGTASTSTVSGSTTTGTTTETFSPSTTFANVQPTATPAPKGSKVLSVFNQDRSGATGITNLNSISTTLRPSTGAFYQGRVWYSGINASQQPIGDAPYTTWSENIYFSQIVESPINFQRCYQTNDPTSQTLFALLPSDGGVITIPGSGNIYKLFPLRFGLLVFAANGIWFIGGSTGIGFTANDFTITKISSIQSISGTSFIDVRGYPMFWNQEGIYQVVPSPQGGSAHSPDIQLDVENLCLGTILQYYDSIPLVSKIYSRGDYDQISYIVQWVFRSTNESGLSNRYIYDTIINYNTVTKAFYPYTLPSNSSSTISDIKYIQNPGGTGAPIPVFKYFTSTASGFTFSEENDFVAFVDFRSENNVGYNYTSYFVAGYSLVGQGLRKIQTPYVYVFTRSGTGSYGIRAVWDYAGSATLGSTDTLSGKWSTRQAITNNLTDFVMAYRKIRLRGRGMAVQIRIDSQPGQPFDIMGWSVWNEVNPGI